MSAEDVQAVQEAETALEALGLDPSEYASALQNLQKRRDGLQNIQQEQQNKFRPEAFVAHGKLNTVEAESDKILLLSRSLRKFAEHIATHTLTLKDTYTTVKDIVDHIPNMGSESL